jgi:peptide/nickel transport system substrate-binding protein
MKKRAIRNLALFLMLFGGVALFIQGCGGGETSTTPTVGDETSQDTSGDDTTTENNDDSTTADTSGDESTATEEPDTTPADDSTSEPTDTTASTEEVRNPTKIVYAPTSEILDSLDPAFVYDSGSGMVIVNVYDNLVFYDGPHPDKFVPMIATDVPSLENGLLQDNSTTYVFPVRSGIKYHYGPITGADGNIIPGSGELTAEDVVYSFQRALLQDRVGGPMWMMWESLFGYSSLLDMARAIEVENGIIGTISNLDGVSDAALLEVCNRVQGAVYQDAENAVFKLDKPFMPFMQIVAGYWGAVLDREFMIAEINDPDAGIVKNADWDGTCETWRGFYDPLIEESSIFDVANGTGPYMLERWRKEEELVLTRNEDYWRERPAYIEQVVIEATSEWASRLLKLQQGDADIITVRTANRDQVQPLIDQGLVTLYPDLPSNGMYFWKVNQDVNMENNPYVGSGQLDGDGVPADFFADIDVRKGFGYVIDYETFAVEINGGDGTRAWNIIPSNVAGFNSEQEFFTFDLAKSEEHFRKAFNGELWEKGFKLTMPYVPGASVVPNLDRLMALYLSEMNPKFQLIPQDFQGTQISRDDEQGKVPLDFSSWGEDYHDAHNWAFPIMHNRGYYANTMSMDADLQARIDEIIEAARNEPDLATREALYFELQAINFDEALSIPLIETRSKRYLRSWMKNFMYNSAYPNDFYFWQYTKEGATN